MVYDAVIIGAGVIGSLVAYELSKIDIKTAVLEKENDVARGATAANSGIVHAGYDPVEGTNKALFNFEGSMLMEELCMKLRVPFKRNGSIVLAFGKHEDEILDELLKRGINNGVCGLEKITPDEALKLEPNISKDITSALNVPYGGIVCPYKLAIMAADVAAINGVEFIFNFEMNSAEKNDGVFKINGTDKIVHTRAIINCAGVYSGAVAKMADSKSNIEITARKGEYMLFDKTAGSLIEHTLFTVPTEEGKGVLVTPTVDGNLMIGPNSQQTDYDDTATSNKGLSAVKKAALRAVPNIPMRSIITSFAGLRATPDMIEHDFIVGFSKDEEDLYNIAGVESPGLTSAPAIAKKAAVDISKKYNFTEKKNYKEEHDFVYSYSEAESEERARKAKEDIRFGRVICRCENVTEGEIVEAIHAPIPATDLDAIKRRTRSQMGRCQGGFCGSKIIEILSRELKIKPEEVTKNGKKSYVIIS